MTASLTGIHASKHGFDRIADDWITHLSAANMYRRPAGAEQLDEPEYCEFLVSEFRNRIAQLGADNVAAFIAEPIMGQGVYSWHRAATTGRCGKICRENDVALYRRRSRHWLRPAGSLFASEEVYDYVPDILVLTKGINSGYVHLGAAIFSEEIYEVISQPQCEGGTLTMGVHVFRAPDSVRGRLEDIEIMEREEICAGVRDVGSYFFEAGAYVARSTYRRRCSG